MGVGTRESKLEMGRSRAGHHLVSNNSCTVAMRDSRSGVVMKARSWLLEANESRDVDFVGSA